MHVLRKYGVKNGKRHLYQLHTLVAEAFVSKETFKSIPDENRDEILYEYQHNGFNYQQAILNVRKRKEEINKLQEQHKEVQLQIDEDAKIVEKVEEITTPKEIIENDEILKVTFTIETTKSNIVELKNWLKERNIKYD